MTLSTPTPYPLPLMLSLPLSRMVPLSPMLTLRSPLTLSKERMLDLELEPLKHHKRSDVNLELEGSDQSVKASSESPDHHHHQGHHDHSSSRHRRHHRHHSKQVHLTSNGELSEAVDLNHPVIETIRI